MQKVITVSLNGIAYQLDENAYAQLHAYLDAAARALATNPDSSEIVADLEQAIAEKCIRFLSPHKNVVKAAEIEQILQEMGPVDGEDSASVGRATDGSGAASAAGAADTDTPGAAPDPRPSGDAGAAGSAEGFAPTGRRLYQISEGAILSGVCTGLAAYFAIDVTIVRAIFVALLFVTGGIALLGYVILMFVVPYASTGEEHAAARGLPFNARILVEGAKQKYARFRQGAEWKGSRTEWRSEWRRMRAEWRAQRRRLRNEWRANARYGSGPGSAPPPGPAAPITAGRYAAHVIGATVIAVLSLVFGLVSIVWLFLLLSLLTTGAVFGFTLPFGVPLWVTILILVLLYQLIAWPIKSMRRAAYYSMGSYHPVWVEAWNGIFALALAAGVLWYGYHHVPELRELFDHLARWWHEATGAGAWT
jgi:phage shock protein PspC (stress-responsive transcriptional regulator)